MTSPPKLHLYIIMLYLIAMTMSGKWQHGKFEPALFLWIIGSKSPFLSRLLLLQWMLTCTEIRQVSKHAGGCTNLTPFVYQPFPLYYVYKLYSRGEGNVSYGGDFNDFTQSIFSLTIIYRLSTVIASCQKRFTKFTYARPFSFHSSLMKRRHLFPDQLTGEHTGHMTAISAFFNEETYGMLAS